MPSPTTTQRSFKFLSRRRTGVEGAARQADEQGFNVTLALGATTVNLLSKRSA
jgi:hypothetical protein